MTDSALSLHSTEQSADSSPGGMVFQQVRVAIISDAIAGRNGVGTYYQDLIQYLKPQVECVEVIGPGPEKDPELESWSFPMPGDRSQRVSFPVKKTLRAKLDDMQPNLIVIPTIGPFSYFAWKYAVAKKIPFVVVHHTNFKQLLSMYWPSIFARPTGWALSKVYAMVMRQSAAVAAMNSDAFEQAQWMGADNVRVMGTPIAPCFANVPTTEPQKKPNRVVFVGRLAAEKGISSLLECVRQVPQAHFTVVGDGPQRNRVDACAAEVDNLEVLGWKEREDVLKEMDRADILLLPSQVETFGTVALEALTRRRYVLVRRECGIAKWPSISKGLFFIEQNETIAEAICRLMEMEGERRDQIAARSWDATRDFNDYTVRVWLRFLADTAFGESVTASSVTEEVTSSESNL